MCYVIIVYINFMLLKNNQILTVVDQVGGSLPSTFSLQLSHYNLLTDLTLIRS